MNILVELIKTAPTGKKRTIEKGPVIFSLTQEVDSIGPTGFNEVHVCRTGFVLGVTGSYDPSMGDDYGRMRKQALEMISKKLYGDIQNLLREALYYLDNHDPKIVRKLLCDALDETELKDKEGQTV